MILTSVLTKVISIFGLLIVTFISGLFIGKKTEKNNQLQNSVKDAIETTIRRNKRRNDSDEVVVKRMKKYVRK